MNRCNHLYKTYESYTPFPYICRYCGTELSETEALGLINTMVILNNRSENMGVFAKIVRAGLSIMEDEDGSD